MPCIHRQSEPMSSDRSLQPEAQQPIANQPSLENDSHCDRQPFSLPELLAPAGNWDCAKAAIENGANAIYFGLDRFNARMRAENFTEADLPELMAFLHQRGAKGYVTLNTLVFTEELAEAESYLRSMISAGVDAVIVQDIGICRLIRHLSPDFPIHASTQMTVTSAAGVAFAKSLGCQLVVLARECSIKEITKIQYQLAGTRISMPLEVFVHGALCVAYSGQCLTSESLGGRSANRGECAQACRMPYELIADGKPVELGDRRYLLSPQDLSGLSVLPELVQSGVTCLKIEGRLKSPEYVASVTRVYRDALDALETEKVSWTVSASDRYTLEMAFSRGLYSGWFEGIDNQTLVHAQYGKKRGVYVGTVKDICHSRPSRRHKKGGAPSPLVLIDLQAPLKPGDGVVFDHGRPDQNEEGGRVYAVSPAGKLTAVSFGNHAINWKRISVGDRLWKTSDPELDRQIRKTMNPATPHYREAMTVDVYGAVGQPLTVVARDRHGHTVQAQSEMVLTEAHSRPLNSEVLRSQFGRLGSTPFELGRLNAHLDGAVMIPMSELNRIRRDIVAMLLDERAKPHRWNLNATASFQKLMPASRPNPALSNTNPTELIVLVRNSEQLRAAIATGISTLYGELEDPRGYRELVQQFRQQATSGQTIWVAPPRITKPLETWILKQVRQCDADGYLIRNYDHLDFFSGDRCIGDFSFNVANPITAAHFMQFPNLERLTASYDLTIQQLETLLTHAPAQWFDITIHQHMPMFHMEHCVFCAFLSDGTDFTNCGRPCETHEVHLRDRVGTEHVLHADAGCRNTVFNGTAQTGAEYVHRLTTLGVRHLRLEFLNESAAQVQTTIRAYQQMLNGELTGRDLWRSLKLNSQLGVTRGPLDSRA
ncbi:MAG: U32 family peptidase [Cyanobacteria bacterium J06633_2]